MELFLNFIQTPVPITFITSNTQKHFTILLIDFSPSFNLTVYTRSHRVFVPHLTLSTTYNFKHLHKHTLSHSCLCTKQMRRNQVKSTHTKGHKRITKRTFFSTYSFVFYVQCEFNKTI